MNNKRTILLVDDSKNDLLLMKVAFRKAEFNNPLQMVQDGEDAIAYLEGRGDYADRGRYPLPGVMLLDLNMPRKTGFDVLDWMRRQAYLRRIPVIILTASVRNEDVERAFDLGANSFLVKPTSIEDLTSMMRCLRDWFYYNQFPTVESSPALRFGPLEFHSRE